MWIRSRARLAGGRAEHLEAVAAPCLGLAGGGSRVADEVVGFGEAVAGDGHPDAGGDGEGVVLHHERRRQAVEQPLGHRGDVALLRPDVAEDDELVPAEAGHRVCRSQARPQALGGHDEHPVAHGVAHAVVHDLKPVEVAEEDGRPRVRPGAAGEGLAHPVHEEQAVRQAGQRVVQGLVGEDALGRLEVGDVRREDLHGRHPGVLDGHADQLDGHLVLARAHQADGHGHVIGAPLGHHGQGGPFVEELGDGVAVVVVHEGGQRPTDDVGRLVEPEQVDAGRVGRHQQAALDDHDGGGVELDRTGQALLAQGEGGLDLGQPVGERGVPGGPALTPLDACAVPCHQVPPRSTPWPAARGTALRRRRD